MPFEPQVKPLSLLRRKILLWFLMTFFVLALPIFIFYATGYRYNFWADVPTITATGGIYITSTLPDASIHVNEEVITNARTFRNATYLQGLDAGVHRIHVQSPGAETWVKELTVLAHIVTEVESFNMPRIPQVRPVTPYSNSDGLPVVIVPSTTTVPFAFASSSVEFVATTSRATSSLSMNREYARVAALFSDKASTTALRARLMAEIASTTARFGPAATTSTSTLALLQSATTTIVSDDVMLFEAGGEVYVKALGSRRTVPLYFCAVAQAVIQQTEAAAASKKTPTNPTEIAEVIEFAPGDLERECRTTIRIDRKWQSVVDFMFMPNDTNLVLMQLTDGLYVVEVDDRSWQNVQLLYPGSNLSILTDSGRIYASSTEGVVEVYTEIPSL